METTILHVYFLVFVSVRSRRLDPMPGTVFRGSLEALLYPPRLNVTKKPSSSADPTAFR